MTQLTNRDQYEADIAEAAEQVLDEYFTRLQKDLGKDPPRSGLDDAFWAAFATALIGALQPKLEAAYTGMLLDIAMETGIELESATASAAQWASQYTFDLVKGMTANRRALLQGAISDFYERGLSLGDLYARLAPEFGMQRAVSIGVTETTRAASEAQKLFGDYLRGRGLKVVDVIETSQDERVCPICGPKQGKRASDEGYPPYHVKCRCFANTVPESEVVS